MEITLESARAVGCISVPSSKSQMIRALLIGLFAKGRSMIYNPLVSQDTLACIELCRTFGARVSLDGKCLVMDSTEAFSDTADKLVSCQNSGTTLYLATAMVCASKVRTTFTGDSSLCSRSAEPLLKSLAELGSDIELTNGFYAPYSVNGPLTGGETTIECRSSQYLSALLLACPLAENDTVIHVPLLYEKPYVLMTEKWLRMQGIMFERNEDMSCYHIKGNQSYKPFETTLTGDFSSACPFFCASAITGGCVTVEGLDMQDAQGDKAVLDILSDMGCTVTSSDFSVTVRGPGKGLKGGIFDLNAIPDTLPCLSVVAALASEPVTLGNVPQARIKETDRISAMAGILSGLGADVTELPDGLSFRPVVSLEGGKASSLGDHRIAMALSVASLRCREKLTIENSEAVDVTFPGFFDRFSLLGMEEQ